MTKYIIFLILFCVLMFSFKTKDNIGETLLQTIKFKIDNRFFKIIWVRGNENASIKNATIYYYDKGKWLKNIDIEVYDQFETTFDCNHDGYHDIYSQSQGWNYINYYLPNKKLFSKQYQMLGDGEIVIDKSKKLYANYREPYHQCNSYNSQLVDYTNSLPHIHYLLSGETFVVDGNCFMDSIEVLKLYKYDQLKDSLILLKSYKPKNAKKFDYKEFWRTNYKKLMK